MKTLMTTFSILIACAAPGLGQNRLSVAADLASAICMGKVRFTAEHGFSRNWSAGIETSFNISKFCKGASEIEIQHWSELYGEQKPAQPIKSDGHSENEIFITYWPKETYSGPLIGAGGLIKERGHPDFSINAGYCCTIWKSLRAVFLYKIGILEFINTQKLPSDGIRIGLSYVF